MVSRYKKTFEKEFKEISDEFSRISELIKEKEKFIELKCRNCNKFSCEVALKDCTLCHLKMCMYCAKQNFSQCISCGKLFCNNCFDLSSKN